MSKARNVPKIKLKWSNSSNIQNYRNFMTILKQMIINEMINEIYQSEGN